MLGICLEVEHLSKRFYTRKNDYVQAVDNVTFSVPQGKVIGIVGQSGSGKSTLARCLVGLYTPDSGVIRVHGKTIVPIGSRLYNPSQSRSINVVFQSPYLSLNPHFSIRQSLEDVCSIHFHESHSQKTHRIEQTMNSLGLDPALLERYPFQLSGGQCQRVCIARLLLLQPFCMVFDEITAALDVINQRKLLAFLSNIHETHNTTMVFITHDLRVAAMISDYIAVMHDGRIVEIGEAQRVLTAPSNMYTQDLLNASVMGIDFRTLPVDRS